MIYDSLSKSKQNDIIEVARHFINMSNLSVKDLITIKEILNKEIEKKCYQNIPIKKV